MNSVEKYYFLKQRDRVKEENNVHKYVPFDEPKYFFTIINHVQHVQPTVPYFKHPQSFKLRLFP